MNEVLKNISRKQKLHNSIISHENHKFCLIIVEIIAYMHAKKTLIEKLSITKKVHISRIVRDKSQTLQIL